MCQTGYQPDVRAGRNVCDRQLGQSQDSSFYGSSRLIESIQCLYRFVRNIMTDNFSVGIMVGKDRVRQSEPGVFRLSDMAEYSIVVTNHLDRRAKARVFVDGKEIVHVKIDPLSSVSIDRPVVVKKCLTYVKADSDGLLHVDPHLGKLYVIYEAEDVSVWKHYQTVPVDNLVECVGMLPMTTLRLPMYKFVRPLGQGGGTIYGNMCLSQDFVHVESFPTDFALMRILRARMIPD